MVVRTLGQALRDGGLHAEDIRQAITGLPDLQQPQMVYDVSRFLYACSTYEGRLALEQVLFGPATFEFSVRAPSPGVATLRLGGHSVRAFGARMRIVPDAVTRRPLGVMANAEVLALFPDEAEEQVLHAQGFAERPAAHVADALAHGRCYRQASNLVVELMQSDVYRVLRANGTTKVRYREWRDMLLLGLEQYAQHQGLERIVSPTSATVCLRWRPRGIWQPSGIDANLAKVVYDDGMPRRGYVRTVLAKPILWEDGLILTEAWVKELPAVRRVDWQASAAPPAGGEAGLGATTQVEDEVRTTDETKSSE